MDDDCKALFERISEYLDGDLEPALCEKIAAHLRDCPQCEDCFEALRRTVGACKELPRHDVSQDIRFRLRETLREWLTDRKSSKRA